MFLDSVMISLLGSNVIKHLLHEMKGTDEYWKLVNNMDGLARQRVSSSCRR
jgi:hypothetical protein